MKEAERTRQSWRSIAKDQARTLYHFTSKQAVPKIFAEGLKTNPVLDMPQELVGKMKGVWLTVNPEMPPLFSYSAEYRFKIAISHTDVRLVHWRSTIRERLTRKHLANVDAETGREWQSFYFYFGNIGATKIRGAERYTTLARIKEYRAEYEARCAELGGG
jgi:hypothetical protein